jgi:hypothetical protein
MRTVVRSAVAEGVLDDGVWVVVLAHPARSTATAISPDAAYVTRFMVYGPLVG